MRLTERLLRAVLRLAPRAFTDRYRDELLDTHRARAHRAAADGPMAAMRLELRELLGGLWAVARLRAGLPQEIRFAFRMLWRKPGYAATSIAVLALGLGATTAIFSAVNAFFFRPLPFADASRLVMLYETNPEFGWTDAVAAPANALDWREQVDAFADVAMYNESFVNRVPYVEDGEPVLFGTSAVSGNFFDVLGARAALGRTFTWDETWEGRDDVVVLSHDLWTTHFGADPGIVGRTLPFGARSVAVVGVMPAGFRFPNHDTQLWYPWGWAPENRQAVFFRRAHWARPIARLAPGVTHAEANAQFQAVVRRLQADYPQTNKVMGAGMMPLRTFLIRDVRKPLMILLVAVGLLLVLACANVANLALVRAAERSHETALRHALGAGPLRMARQVLTESLVLAVLGGLLGLGLGWAGVRAVAGLTPLGIEGATSLALDARVIGFALAVSAASGLVFGLVPALRHPGPGLHRALTEGGRGGSPGGAGLRTAGTLVAVEVALALLLAVGAGLMLRSFYLTRQVDPGFRKDGTLAVQFTVPTARYRSRDNVLAFYDRLAEALESRPEIERVGTVGRLPLTGPNWSSQFQARGWPPERVGFEILHRRADRGYFEALHIPLIRGRLFDAGDRADGPLVVLINETFARQHFPGEDPVGQRIAYDRAATDSSTWYEIVGIVGDQHQVSPSQPPRAEVFEHRNQDWDRANWVVLRTRVEPMSALPLVKSALRELDPLIPLAQVRTFQDVWRDSMAREEFILTLLTAFGGVALLLAAVGVYGVAAQAARQRTREIGIRVALGAAGPQVVRLMLRRSLAMVGLGLGAGLVVSLIAARALGTVLYGVAPHDPATLVAVAMLLATAAGLACYLPARRATTRDPVRSLQQW